MNKKFVFFVRFVVKFTLALHHNSLTHMAAGVDWGVSGKRRRRLELRGGQNTGCGCEPQVRKVAPPSDSFFRGLGPYFSCFPVGLCLQPMPVAVEPQ